MRVRAQLARRDYTRAVTSRSRADLYGWAVVIVAGFGLGLGAGTVMIRILNRHEARTVNRPSTVRPLAEPIGFRR